VGGREWPRRVFGGAFPIPCRCAAAGSRAECVTTGRSPVLACPRAGSRTWGIVRLSLADADRQLRRLAQACSGAGRITPPRPWRPMVEETTPRACEALQHNDFRAHHPLRALLVIHGRAHIAAPAPLALGATVPAICIDPRSGIPGRNGASGVSSRRPAVRRHGRLRDRARTPSRGRRHRRLGGAVARLSLGRDRSRTVRHSPRSRSIDPRR
jgi:hypothetical protein